MPGVSYSFCFFSPASGSIRSSIWQPRTFASLSNW
nr:MAG TPA: hypothetical protein [Caudoviricetes sp.]